MKLIITMNMQTLVMNVKSNWWAWVKYKSSWNTVLFVWMLVKGLVMEVEELGVGKMGVGKIFDASWIDMDFAGDFDEGWVLDRLEVAV